MKKLVIFLLFILMIGVMVFSKVKYKSPLVSDTYSAYVVANEVLEAISREDYKALATYVHSEKGVIFVPFSFIDYEEQAVFTSEQIIGFGTDNNEYIWGVYDQSSENIELTVSEYFKQYVYDKDYINAKQIGVNSIIYQGNSIENIVEKFPNGIFVDFYCSGSEEYEGLDWSSLKVVMEKYNDNYKVVAVIRSCYTA